MNLFKEFIKVVKGKRDAKDMWHYIVGNYRYKIYYGGNLSRKYSIIASIRKRMIRVHIKEQIACRIEWMDRECYEGGSCKLCGCETTALQMCNKACDKPCYPKMMNKEEWRKFNRGSVFKDGEKVWIKYSTTNRPILFIEKANRYVPEII
jgi:hypothetical protein